MTAYFSPPINGVCGSKQHPSTGSMGPAPKLENIGTLEILDAPALRKQATATETLRSRISRMPNGSSVLLVRHGSRVPEFKRVGILDPATALTLALNAAVGEIRKVRDPAA